MVGLRVTALTQISLNSLRTEKGKEKKEEKRREEERREDERPTTTAKRSPTKGHVKKMRTKV